MKIHKLFEDPAKWTEQVWARDKDGRHVLPENPTAVCWCLGGAVDYCYPDQTERAAILHILQLHMRNRGYDEIFTFNDTTGWHTVYQLVKELDI